MPIKVFGTEILFPSDLNNGAFADAVQVDVAAESDTTSGSYTDLTAGAGPIASGVQLNAGQGCLVFLYATMINQTVTGGAYMAFAVSGAEIDAAQDADAAWTNNVERVGVSKVTWYVAGSTGSHTFTAKYKRGASGTAAFANRRLIIKKF
jgi:hypothetical protein